MKPIDEKKSLAEVKRRIHALLKDITESECKEDRVNINYVHYIHFTIRSKDYVLKGTIGKRV